MPKAIEYANAGRVRAVPLVTLRIALSLLGMALFSGGIPLNVRFRVVALIDRCDVNARRGVLSVHDQRRQSVAATHGDGVPDH